MAAEVAHRSKHSTAVKFDSTQMMALKVSTAARFSISWQLTIVSRTNFVA